MFNYLLNASFPCNIFSLYNTFCKPHEVQGTFSFPRVFPDPWEIMQWIKSHGEKRIVRLGGYPRMVITVLSIMFY